MPETNALLALAGRHLLKTYKQPPLVMTRGEGCYLYDTEGRRTSTSTRASRCARSATPTPRW
jgi:acetylornithine/succinyldiaminopimelate/putrescine aminotransferase